MNSTEKFELFKGFYPKEVPFHGVSFSFLFYKMNTSDTKHNGENNNTIVHSCTYEDHCRVWKFLLIFYYREIILQYAFRVTVIFYVLLTIFYAPRWLLALIWYKYMCACVYILKFKWSGIYFLLKCTFSDDYILSTLYENGVWGVWKLQKRASRELSLNKSYMLVKLSFQNHKIFI